MPEQDGQSKGSIFGGSNFLKVVFILGLIVIVASIILSFFGAVDLNKIIFYVVALAIGGAIIYLAIKGLALFLKKPDFSPTGSWREKTIRYGIKGKPFNVHNLVLRGEDMRTMAEWGKIKGLGFIPYVESKLKADKDGKPVYLKNPLTGETLTVKKRVSVKNEDGEYEDQEIETPIQDKEFITHKDGDTVFIVERHKFPKSLLSQDVDIVRANPKYHSDLVGDVYIKDVNLVPFGEYLYPAKQWSTDIIQIETQHKAEALVETYRQWLDLIANVTQMSLASSPEFQKIMMVQAEKLATPGANM